MKCKVKTIVVDSTGFNVNHWSRYSLEHFIFENKNLKVVLDKPEKNRIPFLTLVYEIIINESV